MFTHPNEFFIWNHPENMAGSRPPSKINDNAAVADGVYDDYGHSWLGLVSLMMFLMVCICPVKAKIKIWLKSDEFEGIKITLKDR